MKNLPRMAENFLRTLRKQNLFFLALLWCMIQMEKVFLFLFASSILTL